MAKLLSWQLSHRYRMSGFSLNVCWPLSPNEQQHPTWMEWIRLTVWSEGRKWKRAVHAPDVKGDKWDCNLYGTKWEREWETIGTFRRCECVCSWLDLNVYLACVSRLDLSVSVYSAVCECVCVWSAFVNSEQSNKQRRGDKTLLPTEWESRWPVSREHCWCDMRYGATAKGRRRSANAKLNRISALRSTEIREIEPQWQQIYNRSATFSIVIVILALATSNNGFRCRTLNWTELNNKTDSTRAECEQSFQDATADDDDGNGGGDGKERWWRW